jgi:hypothetical protein
MRATPIGGVLTLVLCLPGALRAQPAAGEPEPPRPKHVASVTMPEIEVRGGPAWGFPATARVRKGEQLFVYFEQDGWLAIQPPPGSVSWVNHRFLGDYDAANNGRQNAVIQATTNAVLMGTDLKSGPIRTARGDAIRAAELPRGTIVTLIGPKIQFDNSTWYPIEPAPGEYRYIARNAVGTLEPVPPPPPIAKTPKPDHEGSPGAPDVTQTGAHQNVSPSTSPAINHPSWARAEQAEQANDWAEAERLYTQIYHDMQRKNADIDQLLACYNRIDRCRERQKLGSTPSFTPPGRNIPSSRPDDNGGRGPASLQSPSTSTSAPRGGEWTTAPAPGSTTSERPGTPPPTGSVAAEAKVQSGGPGYLRKAPFFIDNRQAYALEGERGQLLYYVTAQGGVNLDGYLNHFVELYGTQQVRGDIRGAQYMTVARVNQLK